MSAKTAKASEKMVFKSMTRSGLKDKNIFEQIYDIVRQIPKGRVTSYGIIARAIGSEKSARIIGWAMHSCGNVKPKVPAHRVVNSIGLLSGKHAFKTPTQMEELLKKEGVSVKNNKIVDFKKRFWNPLIEVI